MLLIHSGVFGFYSAGSGCRFPGATDVRVWLTGVRGVYSRVQECRGKKHVPLAPLYVLGHKTSP